MSEQARSQTAHHLHKFLKVVALAALASVLCYLVWSYYAGTTVKARVQRTLRENAQLWGSKLSDAKTATSQDTAVSYLKRSDRPEEVLDAIYELVRNSKDEPVKSRIYYAVTGTEILGAVAHGLGLPVKDSDFSMAQWQSALDALIARKGRDKEEIREPEASLLRVLRDSRAQKKASGIHTP